MNRAVWRQDDSRSIPICTASLSERFMNKQLGRLLLAGVCGLTAVSAAPAQSGPSPGDNADHPSHRPLDSGIGDLAGAEDKLARRLHHTQDVQEIQDLLKKLDDNDIKTMLKDVKNLNDDDIKSLKETIRNNPELLDDPKLHDMLKNVEKFKQGGDLHDLPQEMKDGLAQLAKDIIEKQKQSDPASGNPMIGAPEKHPIAGGLQAAGPSTAARQTFAASGRGFQTGLDHPRSHPGHGRSYQGHRPDARRGGAAHRRPA